MKARSVCFQSAQTQLFTDGHTDTAQAKQNDGSIFAVHDLLSPVPVAHDLKLIGVAPPRPAVSKPHHSLHTVNTLFLCDRVCERQPGHKRMITAGAQLSKLGITPLMLHSIGHHPVSPGVGALGGVPLVHWQLWLQHGWLRSGR